MTRQMILAVALVAALPAPLAIAATKPETGRLKIKPVGARPSDARGGKKAVCRFRLAATGFGGTDTLRYRITRNSRDSLIMISGTMSLDDGKGAGNELRVPDGRYTVAWSGTGASAPRGKKGFRVACDDADSHPGTMIVQSSG